MVTLLLLAATMAEFLTGSTPVPRAITNPLGFLMLVGLYGGGALAIREAAIRWGKRWGAVLLLGGAYAVGEEGFGAKTMVDPLGSNIGKQVSNHFLGINWVPLAALTVFHAAFSIAVPLIIVELLFPETRGRPLVGNIGTTFAIAAYLLVAFLLSWSDPYVPSPWVDAFLAVYALAFIAAAYLVPKDFLRATGEVPDRSELKLVLLGLGFMACFFLIDIFGAFFLPWPVAAALFVPLVALTARYLVKHAGRNENDVVKVDFVLGMVVVFVPIDVIQELKGDLGVLLYTGAILVLLLVIRQRIKMRSPRIAFKRVEDGQLLADRGAHEPRAGAAVWNPKGNSLMCK